MDNAQLLRWAERQGYTFTWADDWHVGSHVEEYGPGSAYDHAPVPITFPVQPLDDDESAADPVTCGTCKRTWDDTVSTQWTPAPSGRCPFESFHGAEPDACEMCVMRDANGDVVDSLGCIDDADEEYRREVEANMVREVYPAWVKAQRRSRSTWRARRRTLRRPIGL